VAFLPFSQALLFLLKSYLRFFIVFSLNKNIFHSISLFVEEEKTIPSQPLSFSQTESLFCLSERRGEKRGKDKR
jgi:hypothetical protein